MKKKNGNVIIINIVGILGTYIYYISVFIKINYNCGYFNISKFMYKQENIYY